MSTTLNQMLSHWGARLGPIHYETTETLTWASAQSSRTIGSSGNLDTVRPLQILSAYYRDASNNDFPIRLVSMEEYQRVFQKGQAGSIPLCMAYNPTISSSLGTLYVWPVPASSWTLLLNSLKPFTAVTSLTSTIVLPPGYEAAIQPNLAVWAQGQFGGRLMPTTQQLAQETLAAIESLNETDEEMDLDPMAPGGGSGGDEINLWTTDT